MKFTVNVEMADRWVPHFLGLLERMRHLGAIGSSRSVVFFADGDGDFRPQFTWSTDLPAPSSATSTVDGVSTFDAG